VRHARVCWSSTRPSRSRDELVDARGLARDWARRHVISVHDHRRKCRAARADPALRSLLRSAAPPEQLRQCVPARNRAHRLAAVTKRFSMLQCGEHADCNGGQNDRDEQRIKNALAARDVGLLLRDPVVSAGYHRRVLIAYRGLRSNDAVPLTAVFNFPDSVCSLDPRESLAGTARPWTALPSNA
jgi:hypothetical protein